MWFCVLFIPILLNPILNSYGQMLCWHEPSLGYVGYMNWDKYYKIKFLYEVDNIVFISFKITTMEVKSQIPKSVHFTTGLESLNFLQLSRLDFYRFLSGILKVFIVLYYHNDHNIMVKLNSILSLKILLIIAVTLFYNSG